MLDVEEEEERTLEVMEEDGRLVEEELELVKVGAGPLGQARPPVAPAGHGTPGGNGMPGGNGGPGGHDAPGGQGAPGGNGPW